MSTHFDLKIGIDLLGEGHDPEEVSKQLESFFAESDDSIDIAPSSFDFKGLVTN